MIIYKNDILNATENIIFHGFNCSGAFGSGLSYQIGKNYPEVKSAYFKKHKTTQWKLGSIQFFEIERNKYILNCATQLTYGRNNDIIYVDYDACEFV